MITVVMSDETVGRGFTLEPKSFVSHHWGSSSRELLIILGSDLYWFVRCLATVIYEVAHGTVYRCVSGLAHNRSRIVGCWTKFTAP